MTTTMTTTGGDFVQLRDVSVGYGERRIVSDVSLGLTKGSITALVGPNGTGKSTLLKAMAEVHGFDGTITVGGKALRDYSRRERVRRLALVAQHGNAQTEMRVRNVVELARLSARGPFARLTDEDRRIIDESMDHSDVHHLADRPWNGLSGGEQQRVQLARATAQTADVLLLDEPTNHLDIHHQFRLMEHMNHLARKHNVLVITALHDLGLAARYCDQVIVLDSGRVDTFGPPMEVFTRDRMARVFGIDAEMTTEKGFPELVVANAVHNWAHAHAPRPDYSH